MRPGFSSNNQRRSWMPKVQIVWWWHPRYWFKSPLFAGYWSGFGDDGAHDFFWFSIYVLMLEIRVWRRDWWSHKFHKLHKEGGEKE